MYFPSFFSCHGCAFRDVERFRPPYKIGEQSAQSMSGSGYFKETEWKLLDEPRSAVHAEPPNLHDQKGFAQAVRLYTVGDKLFREVGDDVGEVLHDINES